MKKPIVIYLIRGMMRDSRHWGEFPLFLSKNIQGLEVKFIDLPGSGIYCDQKSPTRISNIVDFLRIRTGIDNSNTNILLASSLGGVVAMDWINRFHKDFEAMIMLSSSFKGICPFNERVRPSIWKEVIQLIFALKVEKRESILIKINANYNSFQQQHLEEWISFQQKNKMTRINILRQSMAGLRYHVKIKPQLNIPILMIGSKSDRLVCERCIEKSSLFFGADLIWHEKAGHSITLDDPEWTAIQIQNWLNKICN